MSIPLFDLGRLVAQNWVVLPRSPRLQTFELACRACDYRLHVSPLEDVRAVDFRCPICRAQRQRDAEAGWREHFGILAELHPDGAA